MQGILRLEDALIGAARKSTELKDRLPTNKQWRILKDLITLLKPYAMVPKRHGSESYMLPFCR